MTTLATHIRVQWAQHKHRWFYFLQPLIYVVILSVFMGLGGLNGALNTSGQTLQWVLPFYALASLISFQRHYEWLFIEDAQDGSLKQYLIHQQLFFYCLAHVFIWWALTTWPMLLGAVLIACSLGASTLDTALLACTLMLVSIIVTWVCAFSSAITLQHHKADFMRALISLPLLISVYLLALGIHGFQGVFWIVASLSILACTVLPVLTAHALKISIRA